MKTQYDVCVVGRVWCYYESGLKKYFYNKRKSLTVKSQTVGVCCTDIV